MSKTTICLPKPGLPEVVWVIYVVEEACNRHGYWLSSIP